MALSSAQLAGSTSTEPGLQPLPSAEAFEVCNKAVQLETALLAKPKLRFLIVGERHGTTQVPRFFGDIVCFLSKTTSVNVLLEFTEGSIAALRQFVSSGGSQLDRSRLLQDYIWERKRADGRNSAAMFMLIEHLRRLRAAGADIRIYAVQPTRPSMGNRAYYELSMVNRWIDAAVEKPEAINLVLTGVSHAVRTDVYGNGYVSAAGHLPIAESLVIGPTDEGGASWSMNIGADGKPLMGVKALSGKAAPKSGVMPARPEISGWDFQYAFGEGATASPPAVLSVRP